MNWRAVNIDITQTFVNDYVRFVSRRRRRKSSSFLPAEGMTICKKKKLKKTKKNLPLNLLHRNPTVNNLAELLQHKDVLNQAKFIVEGLKRRQDIIASWKTTMLRSKNKNNGLMAQWQVTLVCIFDYLEVFMCDTDWNIRNLLQRVMWTHALTHWCFICI